MQDLDPADLVKKGVIQVMEGRHCFEHLTVEENLLTGAYTDGANRGESRQICTWSTIIFPRLKERRKSQAGYTSGGEQQMCRHWPGADVAGRKPSLLDEPSMGLAPQLVEQIFEIVKSVNEKEGVTFLLAEQNTNVALRFAHYGYILESGRVVMDGPAAELRENPDVKEFYLGMSEEGRKSIPRCAQLPPPQALAELRAAFGGMSALQFHLGDPGKGLLPRVADIGAKVLAFGAQPDVGLCFRAGGEPDRPERTGLVEQLAPVGIANPGGRQDLAAVPC